MSELTNFLKRLKNVGEEFLETAQHNFKLSTLFDMYTEKVIPTFVSDKELKKYYENKMEEVNEFIYKL
ncbi:MAG: hypothetical protein P8Y97_17755 [Candidatus Lokiarchaeota archaeon]